MDGGADGSDEFAEGLVVEMSRVDAGEKTAGQAVYAGDVTRPGMAHAAVVRSERPHARILGVETEEARHAPGVIGVFTAADLAASTYGRRVRDVPVLASEKVRFIGERVAAVVAETRRQAEAAAALVVVEYEELPAVFDPVEALESSSPAVHEAPWAYPNAAVAEGDPVNLQSRVREGSEAATDAALANACYVIDRIYSTPSVHQGYIEPQVCVAEVSPDGTVNLWATNKSPYKLRSGVADCLGIPPQRVVVHPALLGGDFGGKGSPADAPLCAELARLVARPVRLAIRYGEDLTATNPRHPARMRVRLGADEEGRFCALRIDAVLDGGAYAGYKPLAGAGLHGIEDGGSSYRIGALFTAIDIASTNSVPKGHMRGPGGPQVTFAVESAIDELAAIAGIDPVELRRQNLLGPSEPNPRGQVWSEYRGREVLEAAMQSVVTLPVPAGWRHGLGVAFYDRSTFALPSSLRLSELPDGRLLAEVPRPETGTGNLTVVREGLAEKLGFAPEDIEVVQVATDELPDDAGVGGSWVTASVSAALDQAAKAWADRGDGPVTVETRPEGMPRVTSWCVQVAQVALDPESGQVRVLEVLTVLDVAAIVNPVAHRMQLDGGAAMGFGYACLEDLGIIDGQVWAANLGDFKLPSAGDVPAWRTVLLNGSVGLGALNVKAVGEISNTATAGAIANAVAAAGARVRDLPITPERVYGAILAAAQEKELVS